MIVHVEINGKKRGYELPDGADEIFYREAADYLNKKIAQYRRDFGYPDEEIITLMALRGWIAAQKQKKLKEDLLSQFNDLKEALNNYLEAEKSSGRQEFE